MADDIRAATRTARIASRVLAQSSESDRNAALEAMALAIESRSDEILVANAADMEAADALLAEGKLSQALVDRMKLSDLKIANAIVIGVRSVAGQPDPIGHTQASTELDKGLKLYRVSVPIGVIGVIFESRPDALVQIATLCLKSGNAVLLKGGSECRNTNRVLGQILVEATSGLPGIPECWLHVLEAREEVQAILDLDDCIDLVIPRGGNELVQHIMANTKIPVMGHADGICHVYVDRWADLEKADRIVLDAKTDYPSACNAVETVLVHESVADEFVPKVQQTMAEAGVSLKYDAASLDIVGEGDAATDDDWSTEYLDMVLAVKVVRGLDEAVDHVNQFGSHHTESIITEDKASASKFLQAVDAASVLHNASTRFADGFRYGLGAEVGISTNRLHSRGPVGLEGLMIYKYVLKGDGHVAGDYQGDDAKAFTHETLDEVWRPYSGA
ncbi:TPA: glutamate-5-semialdehyde dehydrogenase [Candidatus Latescibacteria bacterium]|nr:glutamate-5-semialdehyde dehydrogenase [Candidatus Latescibacterota bacterium]